MSEPAPADNTFPRHSHPVWKLAGGVCSRAARGLGWLFSGGWCRRRRAKLERVRLRRAYWGYE